VASDKIGTIQRRLAWPLRKDDMIVREGTTFLLFYVLTISRTHAPTLFLLRVTL
jgi:hypothetical protein